MLMYQKSIFDRYYCIKTFSRTKTLEKMPRKGLFRALYTGAKRHVTCERFENAASRAKTNAMSTSEITFATVHVSNDDASVCVGN